MVRCHIRRGDGSEGQRPRSGDHRDSSERSCVQCSHVALGTRPQDGKQETCGRSGKSAKDLFRVLINIEMVGSIRLVRSCGVFAMRNLEWIINPFYPL